MTIFIIALTLVIEKLTNFLKVPKQVSEVPEYPSCPYTCLIGKGNLRLLLFFVTLNQCALENN